MRFVLYSLTRPRHPILRVFSLLIGLALLSVLLLCGLFVGAVLLIGGGLWLALRSPLLNRRGRSHIHAPLPEHTQQQQQILEGEYVVIRQRGSSTR